MSISRGSESRTTPGQSHVGVVVDRGLTTQVNCLEPHLQVYMMAHVKGVTPEVVRQYLSHGIIRV